MSFLLLRNTSQEPLKLPLNCVRRKVKMTWRLSSHFLGRGLTAIIVTSQDYCSENFILILSLSKINQNCKYNNFTVDNPTVGFPVKNRVFCPGIPSYNISGVEIVWRQGGSSAPTYVEPIICGRLPNVYKYLSSIDVPFYSPHRGLPDCCMYL